MMNGIAKFLAVGFLALMSSVSRAETGLSAYTSPLDSKAVTSEGILALIEKIRQRPDWGKSISPADAQAVVDAVMADGRLDWAETDLLEELASDRIRTLALSKAGDPNHIVTFPTLLASSRAPIEEALDMAWEAQWNGGDAGWDALVALYGAGSDHARTRAISIVERKMAAAWSQSNANNEYKPFRQIISSRYAANDKLPADRRRLGKALLAAAAKQVDADDGGRMPDIFYSWIAAN